MGKEIKEINNEILRITQSVVVQVPNYSKFGGYDGERDIYTMDIAKALYNAGYRKQSESTMSQVKQSEWISIEDRLPESPGAYLTYTFRGYTKISHFEEWAVGEEPSFDDYTVTHWMPLPEAPKMKGGAEE